MWFLFVRPEICLHLPSDSTSRWTPLVFGYDLPATGRSRDFHPLEYAHAGRTAKQPPAKRRRLRCLARHSGLWQNGPPCPASPRDARGRPIYNQLIPVKYLSVSLSYPTLIHPLPSNSCKLPVLSHDLWKSPLYKYIVPPPPRIFLPLPAKIAKKITDRPIGLPAAISLYAFLILLNQALMLATAFVVADAYRQNFSRIALQRLPILFFPDLPNSSLNFVVPFQLQHQSRKFCLAGAGQLCPSRNW